MQQGFIYGTAWKKAETAVLVHQALQAGFRTLDVAAQPRHYREDLVGDGIRAALLMGHIRREDIAVQTKFTWTSGQDLDTIPFDPDASVPEQVTESIATSLYNFRPREDPESVAESYIDCVLLHFPLPTLVQTLQAWTTLQEYVPQKIRSLGICNTSLPVLQVLFRAKAATVKPSVVQNRFHAENGYDSELRKYCASKGVVYQAFGVLKANPQLLAAETITKFASELEVTPELALFALAMQLDNTVILNGTTDAQRMLDDLEGLEKVKKWTRLPENQYALDIYRHQFKSFVQRSGN